MLILDLETVPASPEAIFSGKRYIKAFESVKDAFGDIGEKGVTQFGMEKITRNNEKACLEASVDPMFAKIVCIGVIAKLKEDGEDVFVKQSFCGPDEEKILVEFWSFVRRNKIPCATITFNGLKFDLPMLYIRTMFHKIEIPKAWSDLSLRRYVYWPHFDVMRILSWWDFGIGSYRGLSYWAKFFGYDCDPENEPDGSMVSKWYAVGDFQRIIDYNMTDCEKTGYVFKSIKNYFPSVPGVRARKVGSNYD